jgi:biliverdin reductase
MTQNQPLRVGLIGTGFAAKLRADTFYADDRTHLVAIAGNDFDRTQIFAQPYHAKILSDWVELVQREDIDLVAICTINSRHGAIARLALQHGKHVIVEYPLSLDPVEAEELVTLAATQHLLLHVEHIELLGGLHQALIQSLPAIEPASYVRYVTIAPKHPAPRRWTYNSELFGFPLVGALSRLHRLIDRFGEVANASAQARFWEAPEPGFNRACLCTAQLQFTSGVLGEVVYGKGETFWQAQNRMEVHGERGTLILEPDKGELIRDGVVQPLTIGTRRGLFTKDTTMAIDYLVDGVADGKPLYVSNTESVYTLKIADRLRQLAIANELPATISRYD